MHTSSEHSHEYSAAALNKKMDEEEGKEENEEGDYEEVRQHTQLGSQERNCVRKRVGKSGLHFVFINWTFV